MKCLVTGMSGFIGRHLVARLEQQGHQVIRVPHKDTDYPVLKVFIQPFDYLFHLAAYGNHYNQTDEREMMLANVVNLFDILTLTKDVDYKGFINFSTSSVALPTQTIYSTTKKMGEELCRFYAKRLPITIVRPYSVFGEGEADFRFIPTVFRSCMYGKEMLLDPLPVHDFVYIEDFIDALFIAMDKKGETVEIGTGKATTNLEIVKEIELITGKKANYKLSASLRDYDNENWYCRNPLKDWK